MTGYGSIEVFAPLGLFRDTAHVRGNQWATLFGLPDVPKGERRFTLGQVAVIYACHEQIEGPMRDRLAREAGFIDWSVNWLGHRWIVFPLDSTNAYGTAEPSRIGPLCRGGAHVIDLDAVRAKLAQSSPGVMPGAGGDRRDGGSAAAVPAAPAPEAVA